MARVGIECLRHSNASRMDYENLCWSFKPIIDGLVDAEVLVDDSMDVIVERHYARGERPPPRQGWVSVELWPVEN